MVSPGRGPSSFVDGRRCSCAQRQRCAVHLKHLLKASLAKSFVGIERLFDWLLCFRIRIRNGSPTAYAIAAVVATAILSVGCRNADDERVKCVEAPESAPTLVEVPESAPTLQSRSRRRIDRRLHWRVVAVRVVRESDGDPIPSVRLVAMRADAGSFGGAIALDGTVARTSSIPNDTESGSQYVTDYGGVASMWLPIAPVVVFAESDSHFGRALVHEDDASVCIELRRYDAYRVAVMDEHERPVSDVLLVHSGAVGNVEIDQSVGVTGEDGVAIMHAARRSARILHFVRAPFVSSSPCSVDIELSVQTNEPVKFRVGEHRRVCFKSHRSDEASPERSNVAILASRDPWDPLLLGVEFWLPLSARCGDGMESIAMAVSTDVSPSVWIGQWCDFITDDAIGIECSCAPR